MSRLLISALLALSLGARAADTLVSLSAALSAKTSEREACQLVLRTLFDRPEGDPPPGGEKLPPFIARRKLLQKVYDVLDSVNEREVDTMKKFDAEVKIVASPQEGFAAKILLIRKARQSIDISTLILARDRVGYALLGELKKAIERGVSVRLVADSIGSMHLTHSEMKALKAVTPGFVRDENGNPTSQRATVEMVTFNPVVHFMNEPRLWYRRLSNLFHSKNRALDLHNVRTNHRLHDKIFLVDADDPDNAVAMLGGRNLQEVYFGVPDSVDAWEDMEILIKGKSGQQRPGAPLAETLGHHFDRLYYHLGNKYLSRSYLRLWDLDYKHEHAKMEKAQAEVFGDGTVLKSLMDRMESGDYFNDGFSASSAQVVNEIANITRENALSNWVPGAGNNPATILGNMYKALMSAKKTIDLVSPYPYFTPEEVAWMHDWLRADPERRIRLVTNSLMTSDAIPAQAMIDHVVVPDLLKDSNLSDRIEVWCYGKADATNLGGQRNYGMIHAKYAVIDSERSLVTSFNADPRSRYLHSEVGVFIDAPEAAQDLDANTTRLIEASTRWGSREWHQIREHKKNAWRLQLNNLSDRLIRDFNLLPQL